ncbi:Chemotaxis protein methyltransferase CheR [Minicystis rosea]|nr:Chemotaxis protein methyltransferase CheR [Minicystis rosea]
MSVLEATPGAKLEANCVYVVPPSSVMAYADGHLVGAEGTSAFPTLPIDALLRSLAHHRQSRAIGVILSGNGSDGALGVEAIKGEGGITFAQDARSAKFDAMPLSAIGTGCVDYMLPPEEIAARLGEIAARLGPPVDAAPLSSTVSDADLARVFSVLRATHGLDFSHYRQSTMRRRIHRRALLSHAASAAEYIETLAARPLEIDALCQDLLIRVTHFFRDPETFTVMQREVLPAILRAREDDAPIRIWVPGCATGEEAYSLAIAFVETTSALGVSVPYQIFATDVSEEALTKARAGTYLENIAADVSPERRERFFTRNGKELTISSSIRDACLFARQDITKDPPFSRLDLISCRNVLLYFEAALQERVISTLHFALRPDGYLMIGSAEPISPLAEHFTLVDKRHRIYAKSPGPARPVVSPAARASDAPARPFDLQAEADRVVMMRHAPPGVVVNADLQIVQFRGHTGPYIEPAPGEATLNILKMARDGLVVDLRAALHKARRSAAPVRAERVPLRIDGMRREVTIDVIPLSGEPSRAARFYLVLFQETAAAAKERPRPKGKGKDEAHIARLERDLAAAKEYLRLAVEENEAIHEELLSTNEELSSSNEELQTINEALQAVRDDLESSNEALALQNRALELGTIDLQRSHDDLSSLLGSVGLPLVLLGIDRRIRRFTPQAARVLELIPSDVGRPLRDVGPRIEVPDLDQLVTDVIDSVSIREREVEVRDGRRYLMRLRPCRTTDNRIDGAVMVLFDVDRHKRTVPGDEALMEH